MLIKTGPQLAAVINKLFEDAGLKSQLHRKALDEKEKQDSTSTDLFGDGDSSADKTDAAPTEPASDSSDSEPSKTMDADSEELKKGDVTVDSIVEKLNTIRSGKSFREDAVKHAMEEYVNSLKMPERVALLAFLKGIAQITTGEVAGAQAVDPADPDPSVAMKKDGSSGGDQSKASGGQKKVSITPNVIKKSSEPAPQKKKPEKGEEDTTPPAPITPTRK